MRRSSRLRKKKRVNYNEDSLWERAIGGARNLGRRLDTGPPERKAPPRPVFQKKKLFRPKIKPNSKPKVPKQLVRVKPQPRSAIERDEDVVEIIDLSAEDRVVRVQDRRKLVPIRKLVMSKPQMSSKRKQMLFMNPGDEKIMQAVYALSQGARLPSWANKFANHLTVKGGRLYWRDSDRGGVSEFPFATKGEKRTRVKACYFDPREPSTIEPITLKLREEYANITKRDVTNILRSLVTYQRNFRRRRPPDIKNRMFLYNPGMIAMDMFFPSVNDGWERYNCLTCMDTWSRYVGVYAISTKKYEDVIWAMKDFLSKFASLGHLPRRILSDKGTDMAGAVQAIEPYRTPRDGRKPMVLHSATGTPVLIVEGLNAQIQRRMQIFRTAGLIESPAQILHEIAEQINNEPRQARGGMTPLQLLALDQSGRDQINALYREREIPTHEVHGLSALELGPVVAHDAQRTRNQ